MNSSEPEIKISPHFWLRRLHSLTGVFPVGAFLLEHMFSNAYIIGGPKAYNEQIAFLTGLPYLIWLEVFFIWVPILYHALYGFYVMFTGKNNLASYPYVGNALYSLQRWTGMITFGYILYHFYETRLMSLLYGTEVSYARMQQLMSDPKRFWFYVIGLAAVVFHFGNGLWGFLISWGITIGPKAQRISGIVCTGVGLMLFAVGVDALVHLIR